MTMTQRRDVNTKLTLEVERVPPESKCGRLMVIDTLMYGRSKIHVTSRRCGHSLLLTVRRILAVKFQSSNLSS